MATKYKVHPFCERFPRMTAEEYRETKESISRLGRLTDPLEVWGNKLIDGRNRSDICEELGIDPGRPKEWHPPAECFTAEEQDAALWEYLKAKNLCRRHLNSGQVAMIRAADVTDGRGGDRKSKRENSRFDPDKKTTQKEVAAEAHIDRKTLAAAEKVVESGTPALQEAVRDGEVSVSDAAKIVEEPAKVQNAAVKAVRTKESKTVTKAVKAVKEEAAEREPGEEPEAPLVKDHFKVAVPAELAEVFSQCEEFRSLMAALSDCKSRATALASTPGGGWLDIQEIERLLTDARAAIRFGMPYTECPKCRRKPVKKCPTCKGTGWITESLYKTSASDDDKAWLEARS